MANEVELSSIEDLGTVGSGDKILGYSVAGNKFGFVPVSFITRSGYACRRWDTTVSTPIGEAYGNIDYLRDLPNLLGLGCYLVTENKGKRKLDPTNHYKFTTGETASLDGSMGDYMWCWNEHYYSWWMEGQYYYEAISLNPIPGKMNYRVPAGGYSALGVSVVDRENNKLVSVINSSARYRGADNSATYIAYDGTFKSQLGKAATKESSIQYGAYARNKGDGWEAGWYAHHAIIAAMFRIIMGTRNCQSAFNSNKDINGLYQGGLGAGVTSYGGKWTTDFGDTMPFLPTSVGVEIGDACGVSNYIVKGSSGETLYTAPVPVFFGLKNAFGYLGRWERGSVINKKSDGSGDTYVATNMYPSFNPNSLTGLIKTGTVPAAAVASQAEFIKTVNMLNLQNLPTVTGGTEITYFSDAFYNDNATSGLRIPFRGGTATNGGTAGFEFVYVDTAASNAYVSAGSPLCFSEADWSTVPFYVA